MRQLRLPDAVGNLFQTADRGDRRYGPAGQLLEARGARYQYDALGNLVRKTLPTGEEWHYTWDSAGRLAEVLRPDGGVLRFAYDALGRRVSKSYQDRVTRWVWDGNKPLHEWCTPKTSFRADTPENMATWLFEDDSFNPLGKLHDGRHYSVVADHLATPLQMHDQHGQQTWAAELDSYGQVRQGKGEPQDCPFRYQGQYEDAETGLYYNRFRYYDPHAGQYISQDPIGLRGGGRIYGYVYDPTIWLDVLGLMPFWKPLKPTGMGHHPIPRTHANSHGLPALGTEYDSPSWYPNQVDGSDDLHKRFHQAVKDKGVPFNRPFVGTQEQLIDKVKEAYDGFDDKEFLKIPSTGEVISSDITIREAVDKQLEWNGKQPKPGCPT